MRFTSRGRLVPFRERDHLQVFWHGWCGSFALGAVDDEYRAVGVVDDLLTDGAEQQACEAAAAAVADHDKRGVARLVEEHLGRLSFERPTFGVDRGLQPLRFRERF